MRGKNAYDDLIGYLIDGEVVEAIYLGQWTGREDKGSVPASKQFGCLSLDDAKQFMLDWSYYGGYGEPTTYDSIVWTNERVITVHEYDGSTSLQGVPRNPPVRN